MLSDMSDHAFQRAGAVLSNEEVVFICRALKADQLALLCLRECEVRQHDFERILKLVGSCRSLHQLTLNVGMVTSMRQVELLAQCIKKNKSLTGLHVHGNDLGDVGMQMVGHAVSVHPGIVSLDVGDCKLSDMSMDVLYSLMLPVSDRPGLTELTLSDNPRISALGWAQFGMCLANCNTIRWLFLDYNPLGDYGASCMLVALSASQSVEVLDLEGCGLTEHTGQAMLHLVQNHLGGLSKVKLYNNRIRRSTIEAIKKHISDNHLDSVSTVTAGDLFSMNTTRISSTCKTLKHHQPTSSSSSSSEDSPSVHGKVKDKTVVAYEKESKLNKKQCRDRKKRDNEEDTDLETKSNQYEDRTIDKTKVQKKGNNKETDETGWHNKNPDQIKDNQNKDKQKKTGKEKKKDIQKWKDSDEVVESEENKKQNKTFKEKNKVKDSKGRSKDKVGGKHKYKDNGKKATTDNKKDRQENEKSGEKRGDKIEEKENQKKIMMIASDDETDENVNGSDDEESLGDELHEVPVFYK